MAVWFTRVPFVQKVWSSIPEPTESYAALQAVCHRFNIYTSIATLPWCAVLWRWAVATQTRSKLWHNTTSLMKGLVYLGLQYVWFNLKTRLHQD